MRTESPKRSSLVKLSETYFETSNGKDATFVLERKPSKYTYYTCISLHYDIYVCRTYFIFLLVSYTN